ncbi:outer membrane beta-barrel protein [Geofilum sp. OHC36d9]|uniref:outer membrane beta-barrel protein n=1 Tax=Geofilum sp. OHC36d9 TaxID=3458413 RepID=UPI0040341FA8
MKCSLAITVFLWFSAIAVSAQFFKGGVKGGMTASQVSGDHLSGLDKFGFYGAVYTMYPISTVSYLQMEVMYIQKGSRSIPGEKNDYFDYKFALHYVEVPLLYVYNISDFFQHNAFDDVLLYGGLSVSKLVGYSETQDDQSLSGSYNTRYKPVELNFLAGFCYPLTSSLYATFGYSNSLTTIRSSSISSSNGLTSGQYNSVWSLGLSFVVW